VRYEFLEQAARRLGSQFVATGHTRDDQLETILWRLYRSDDLHGLAGIPVSRPIREGSSIVLVRPLLEVSRQALQDYLSARQVPWQTDHTNRDLARTRNLIRHRLLPVVRNRLGEGYLQDLLDFADRVGQVDRRGRELIEHQLGSHAERSERGLALPVDWLRSLPEHFRHAVLYRALRQAELESAPPGRFLDSALTRQHVRVVARAVEAAGPVLIDQLPGDLVAERTDSELIIGEKRGRKRGRGSFSSSTHVSSSYGAKKKIPVPFSPSVQSNPDFLRHRTHVLGGERILLGGGEVFEHEGGVGVETVQFAEVGRVVQAAQAGTNFA
ncbi:MAG: tRNA lysidine(34) synthetase TilS, partial [Planctomycetes bacterium]|nr:tRNA lysidine(34) synthetase TilS [Planctomycetota bacterium]